jgi:hypothetical protein
LAASVELAYPLALTIREAAGWPEAAASVETVGAIVVFMSPEANLPVVVSSCVCHNSVEEQSNSLSPARRNDVEIAEEQAAWDHRTRPMLLPHRLGGRHPKQRR